MEQARCFEGGFGIAGWKRRGVRKGDGRGGGGWAGEISSGDSIVAGPETAVVETASGKVAGYVHKGVFTFKGIPYGDTTEGANRFMAPAPAKPWTGVRSSRYFGHVSPQGARGGWSNDEESFLFRWDDGIQGEDCLRINLWTPAVNDGKSGR